MDSSDTLAGLRIAVYARFSSANQRDKSIDDQVRGCKQAIARLDGVVDDELVVADKAESGASTARAGFEKLLHLIETKAVDVVVTESGDRLTRDLGDADRLWKLAEYHGVRLICVADGVDSARDGARMAFQFKAILSDQYLVNLRKQTLRGLVGAAELGHATGGLPLGYTSRAVWGNNKREPDYFEIITDEDARIIIIRIFEMYRDGFSCRSIARILNEEGVPTPRAKTKHRRKGWVMGTIHAMLRNEAYIGRWRFLYRQWRKIPGTNVRRYKKRPDEDVLFQERPLLRIVPEDLWQAVRQRRETIAAKYKGDGPMTVAARRTSYPLSGLLKCGACNFPMVIAGGSPNRVYKCSGHRDRGICQNGVPLREDVIRHSVLAELSALLLSDQGVFHARKRIAERLGDAARARADEERRLAGEVQRLDVQVRRLVEFIANGEADIGSVREVLREKQAEKARLQEPLEALRSKHQEPIRLPSPEEVRQSVLDLEAATTHDPIRARSVLARLFLDGTITVDPQPDRSYIARSEVLPLMLVPPKKPKPQRGAGASVVYNVSCAGAIPAFYTEYRLPFRIAPATAPVGLDGR